MVQNCENFCKLFYFKGFLNKHIFYNYEERKKMFLFIYNFLESCRFKAGGLNTNDN